MRMEAWEGWAVAVGMGAGWVVSVVVWVCWVLVEADLVHRRPWPAR